MAEDVAEFIGAQGTVDRHMHHVGQVGAHVHEVPLRTVVADGDDLGAGAQAQGQQTIGDGMGEADIIVYTVFDPLALDADGQDIILGGVLLQVFQQVECSENLHKA